MTQFAVSTVFNAVDGMSPVFATMAKNADQAFASMNKNAISTGEKLKQGLNKAATGLGIAGAGMLTASGIVSSKLGVFDLPENAMNMEHDLIMLGNVGNLTKQQIAGMNDELLKTAEQVNQMPEDLVRGVQSLVAGGFDPQLAMKFIEPIGKAATATGADMVALAQTVQTNFETMGIPIENAYSALNKLAAAGKAGKFELKDMAQYFPMLAADASMMGIRGEKGLTQIAAAAQIARKGTGDAASAATNLDNFLQKMASQETVKNFRKYGIDILKVKNEAIKTGADPFLAIMEATNKATKGNADMIGRIFTDMQVKKFVAVMTQQLDNYKNIRDQIASGGDTIGQDFNNIMDSAKENYKKFKIEVQTGLLPEVTPWLRDFTDGLKKIKEYGFDPATIGKIALAVTGLGGALLFTSAALGTVAKAIEIVSFFGAASIATFGAIAFAIVGVGAALYQTVKHWDELKAGFMRMVHGDILGTERKEYQYKNADDMYAAMAKDREWEKKHRAKLAAEGYAAQYDALAMQSGATAFNPAVISGETSTGQIITPETVRQSYFESTMKSVTSSERGKIDLTIKSDQPVRVENNETNGQFNITNTYTPAFR